MAKDLGFAAMQFNFVVSTNVRAVGLWQSLGFDVVGRLPGAFAHQVLDRKLALSLCGPVLPQIAIAEFLASGAYDTHMRRLRRLRRLPGGWWGMGMGCWRGWRITCVCVCV